MGAKLDSVLGRYLASTESTTRFPRPRAGSKVQDADTKLGITKHAPTTGGSIHDALGSDEFNGEALSSDMKASPAQTPLVSVIVPTRESALTLEKCLRSIRSQNGTTFEIIVVDNHSSDQTQEIAQRFADRLIVAGPERSAQTNVGVRVARGKYIYRVDSDFILDPHLLSKAVNLAETTRLDGVLVPNRSDPTVGFWARVRAFEREMYVGDSVNVAARFIRRDRFIEVGGFDEDLVAGEDYDLHQRLCRAGAKIAWVDAGETHLGEPRSIREVFSKHRAYGRELRRYVRKHPKEAMVKLSPIRLAYWRNRRVLLRHPLRTLGLLIYTTVKYSAGALGFFGLRRSGGHVE